MLKTSMDSPLLNSALTNPCQETPKEDEKKSSACVNSSQKQDAMREESACSSKKEEQAMINALQEVHHCGCSHTKQGEC